MIELPESAFRALEYLAAYGPAFCQDIPAEEYFWFLHLKEKGLAKMELPDPNFLYLLPPEKRGWYQMKITGEGFTLLQLHKEKLQKEIDIEAKREAKRLEDVLRSEQNRKKQFRHDWWIAIFTAVTGFISGAVTDHFFDVIVNAVRLWEFILVLLA